MASPSSSSSSSDKKYDVFLSFRGIDTRKSFVGFLYKELERKCIKTFKDDREIDKGSSISPELIQAIECSRFAIVVLSENYASSSWCLDELAKITECEEKKSLTAIPIFYEVDPSHVRRQMGKCAEHFEKHEKRENPDKVKRWSDALKNLGNKSGFDSRNWEDNAELIDEITKDILNRLNSAATSDFTDLVGMDVHLQTMYELLDLESDDDVRMIGIWGMGGAGKTTLARYSYEKISQHFKTCCFLEDVKKIYDHAGSLGLQKELVSRIEGEDPRNSYLGSNVIKERLERQKVLLVVDNVDDVGQLDSLAKEDRWFGNGSRVIVTTRDKHLLNSRGIKHVYEVECLADNEALQLFCQYAFRPPRKQPPEGFQNLSERAVDIAGGLPLALKVFGSFLCGRYDKGFWEDAFDSLEESLDVEKVMKILKISYDGLSKGHRDIFLYVACFYDGVVESENHLADVLSNKGAKSGVRVLADKSLVSISKYGKISMHDLIKKMGREIGDQQFSDDPAKRMILWKPDDVDEVLTGERVAGAVKAISLDLDKVGEFNMEEEITKKVPNLNLLHIYTSSRCCGEKRLQIPYDLRISFPNKLRYLRWDSYPYRSLQFNAKNLVKLEFRYSNMEKLWDGSPCLENLKEIDVCESHHLTELPDVSNASNLEVITAIGCTRLTELPQSICSLDKLTKLDLGACSELRHLPNNMDMKSLEHVRLDYCQS